MRIVMTLVVRDEADIIADQLDFHLAVGVDFVIATDHRSQDGTTDILRDYEGRGVVRLLREEGEFVQQGEWLTRMSRLAALEHDADWVIASDADEFWWPRGPSLEASLAAVPSGIDVVRAVMHGFVPLYDDDGYFAERMTVRLSPPAPINDPTTPYRPHVKVAHRADPRAVLSGYGAHSVAGLPGSVLRPWSPLDVLHFPLRTRSQCERKYRRTLTGWETNLRGDLARAARGAPRPDLVWEAIALEESDITRGLEAGSLSVDNRLRDALRAVHEGVALDVLRNAGSSNVAVDMAVFEEAELVRRARVVDGLARRIALVSESRPTDR
jgi:hypothetical protein